MTPHNITRSNLSALSTLLVPVALGMLLLGMVFLASQHGSRSSQEVVFTDSPQPQPATCNKTMILYLQAEYRLYQRCLAQKRPFAPECRRLTQEAIEAYNQVAGDTDPSAFDLTALPRHLDCPNLQFPF